MNENEFAELAAGHALHALSDADEQRYADALRAHPEWSAVAAHDAETAAMLAEASPPAAPPASIRDALLAQIAVTPQIAEPHTDERPVPLRPKRRLWFALAASIALVVALGVGTALLVPLLTPPASVVALEDIEAAPDARQATVELESGAQATAHWSASEGSAVLVVDGLEALEGGLTYELWFVRGEEPVSAGVFETDAGSATALLEGRMQEGDVIAVTVEQSGGSPAGVPTTDPILAIPTA